MGNSCCKMFRDRGSDGPFLQNGGKGIVRLDSQDDRAKVQDRENLVLLHEKVKAEAAQAEEIPTVESETSLALTASISSSSTSATRNEKRSNIRATVFSEEKAMSFKPPTFPKSEECTKFLLDALDDNFIFDTIDNETKLLFVNAMQLHEFNEGDWVMHQGGDGDYFYVVQNGDVGFHVEPDLPKGVKSSTSSKDNDPKNLPTQVGTGIKGSTFGELALLYNTPRAASIRALSSLTTYKIDRLTFQSILFSSQNTARSDILALVKKQEVFHGLDDVQVQKLADALTMMEFDAGEMIVNKGDEGNVLYIVKTGQVKLSDIGHGCSKFDDQVLEEGESFGERALIEGETRGRAANVSALTQPTVVLAISKGVLEEIIGPLERALMESSYCMYLESTPLMKNLTPEEITRCVPRLKDESYKQGDKILAKGKLYLIQEGSALMMVSKQVQNTSHSVDDRKKQASETMLVKLEKGDYFGNIWAEAGSEEANGLTNSGTMSKEYVNVESDMKCLTLLASDIREIVGDLDRMSLATSDSDDEEERATKFKTMNAHRITVESHDLVKARKPTLYRDKLTLKMLEKHHILGAGTFGKVWLVTRKESRSSSKDQSSKDKEGPYALKMISKRQLLQSNLTSAVLREKNVMESINHPFLLNMAGSFQDENYIYFALELILGGELFDVIYGKNKKANRINPAFKASPFWQSFGSQSDKPMIKGSDGVGVRQAVFYSACVMEAFTYLHSRRIVYRDLKPENVMVNENGYCVVVDMGFAKVVLDKTYTMCGTPEYLSPEVIISTGHNHSADHWSFGCLLYELIMGRTPFYKPGIDHLSMLKMAVMAKYEFPPEVSKLSESSTGIDKALYQWKDLVSRLLKNRSTERIGNLKNGIADILDHGWFENVNFYELRDHGVPGPWLPTTKDPFDAPRDPKRDVPDVFPDKLSAKDQAAFQGF